MVAPLYVSPFVACLFWLVPVCDRYLGRLGRVLVLILYFTARAPAAARVLVCVTEELSHDTHVHIIHI